MNAGTLEWIALADGRAAPTVAFGSPEAPLVLVLPGLSDGCAPLSEEGIRADVQPPPRPLRRYRVVLASYRHPMPETVTTAELAEDAATLIERLGEGRPAVVTGHSMGGMVAQHLAADHPELIDRLVLSASAARADDVFCERLEHWDELLLENRHQDFVRDAVDVSYTGPELRIRRLMARLTAPPDLSANVSRHLALSRASRTHDARDRLGDVTAPALVLGGSDDPLVRIGAVRDLAERLRTGRMVELEGLAHGLPEQGRRRYVRELVGFLHTATTRSS